MSGTCARGCRHRPTAGGEAVPHQTRGDDVLCHRCIATLTRWLTDIPDIYALLPLVAEHGTVPQDPDHRRGRRRTAPAPMRLDILDLTDERRGRRWYGTIPSAADYRGTLGTLEAWGRMVREERHTTHPTDTGTVAGEAASLLRHLPWIVTQPWCVELYDELRPLVRDLTTAIGDHRPKPVGTCQATIRRRTEAGTQQVTVCGGPLFQSSKGPGVHCPACGDTWKLADLRRLADHLPAALLQGTSA